MFPVLKRNRLSPAARVGWDVFDGGREFDRLFGTTFLAPTLTAWSPAVDVRESDDDFVVTAELPGLAKDAVDITIENGVLSLSGEKKEEREEGKADSGRYVLERRYGRFQRSFSLPRGVATDNISAKFSDGILTVTLPKAATAKPRQIKIGS
ncbi:MAG: Hsp20/alpha crystallin family protein [Gemmatimonadetes bacterium]|nr:Hsp20/alpha crystallin family protein [Gemmatimonadota bacterium]